MSVEREIFDIEGQLEKAFEADLNVLEIPVRIPNSDPAFQLERSRVDAFAKQGRWLGTLKGEMGVATEPGSMRETSFDVAFRFTVITRADGEVHETFRASVRNRISKCVGRLNKTLLARHRLIRIETVGSEPDYASNQGRFVTELHYNGKVSIQDDAWDDLAAEEAQESSDGPYFIQCDTGGAFQLAAALDAEGVATFTATGDIAVNSSKTLLPNDSDGLFYEYHCADQNTLSLSQVASEEQDWPGVYFQFDLSIYQMRCRTEGATKVPYLKLVA